MRRSVNARALVTDMCVTSLQVRAWNYLPHPDPRLTTPSFLQVVYQYVRDDESPPPGMICATPEHPLFSKTPSVDSDEERRLGLRTMADMYEDTPYNGYWDD